MPRGVEYYLLVALILGTTFVGAICIKAFYMLTYDGILKNIFAFALGGTFTPFLFLLLKANQEALDDHEHENL